MNEQKTSPESSPNGLTTGSNTESTQLITDANNVAERMEKASSALKQENDRREAIIAREILGGRSSGATIQEPIKEESAKEYRDRVLRGDFNKK